MIALVVNPGASKVRLACADIQPSEAAQLQLRLQRAEVPLPAAQDLLTEVLAATEREGWPQPDAVVSGGVLPGQVTGGTYQITLELLGHVQAELGPQSAVGMALAYSLAQRWGVPAYLVDPPSVSELIPEAREVGLLGLGRTPQFHALNARMVARRAADEVGKRFAEAGAVVAHLGSTASVTSFEKGRAIDTSGNGLEGGPMGLRQAGPVAAQTFLRWLESQGTERRSPAELRQLVLETPGGLVALTGTAQLSELQEREAHDPAVQQAAKALAFQTARAIGAQCAALSSRPDVIAITGPLAYWDSVVERLERRLAWIAPVLVFPGEIETEALAQGAGRALLELETPLTWTPPQAAPAAASPAPRSFSGAPIVI
ncbi:butyrate kinase [Deinococcus lacus]|uniref:Butyrate kinase n=1 Tax=Deinococcus lacus TaxID=392561 RepID=A0ABW1Y9C5_9DEIO